SALTDPPVSPLAEEPMADRGRGPCRTVRNVGATSESVTSPRRWVDGDRRLRLPNLHVGDEAKTPRCALRAGDDTLATTTQTFVVARRTVGSSGLPTSTMSAPTPVATPCSTVSTS